MAKLQEPYEFLTIDVEKIIKATPSKCWDSVKANFSMGANNKGRTRLDYMVPARGLLDLRPNF